MWDTLAPGAAPPTPRSPNSPHGISVCDWQNTGEDDISWAINEDCYMTGPDTSPLGHWEKDTPKELVQPAKSAIDAFSQTSTARVWNDCAPQAAQDLTVWTSYVSNDRRSGRQQYISPTSPTSSSSSYRRPRSIPSAVHTMNQQTVSPYQSSHYASSHSFASPELLSLPDIDMGGYTAGVTSPEYRLNNSAASTDVYGCSSQNVTGDSMMSGNFFTEQSALSEFNNFTDLAPGYSHEPNFSSMGAYMGSHTYDPTFTESATTGQNMAQHGFQQPSTSMYAPQFPQSTAQSHLRSQGPWQHIAIKNEGHAESSAASSSHTPTASTPRSYLGDQNKSRDHWLYGEGKGNDGLYHCPYARDTENQCKHKPTKLKCNYDKYIDSHLKPFHCKVATCGDQQFSSTACLLRHEREAHGLHGHGDKPHLCKYRSCERSVDGKGFPRHYNLMDHMRRMHGHEGDEDNVPEDQRIVTAMQGHSGQGRKRKSGGRSRRDVE
ncbi:hypothetical protein K461DRAFT_117566 [Myriangium duriaei CBS 260.36]|uniref:C2H2-type domain-containing protein n=1 Tax=Myriangium duriaei CBS 260.36 TaxID=1168546 RepID=A0A9P4MNM3_9PEZI|nr:hypothetical protein K461DRAFT_117566 [Myriangium duriaei CBS 260.36]